MKDFYVAGIGASGGGLQALFEFFSHLPRITGIAYVVVTHLKSNHRSRLAGMISKHTDIPVTRVEQDVMLQPDRIYVLSENIFITVRDSVLLVRRRKPDEIINRAIDIFFTALAEDFTDKAIGIVLSGAGEDGLQGAKEIEERGGFVMAQNPEQATFKSMPLAIIEQDSPTIIADTAALAHIVADQVWSRQAVT